MNNTQLIIENLYFKQLLSEEVAFFDQYESLFGDRTKEFFQHYIDGLSAQKELILQLENLEITEQLIQEKFGDQFAAKAAGLGAKARAGINKLATGGKLGGTLGNWVQNKFGVKGSTTDAGNEAYLKARNQNFTRSLGDYLGQLKTFDKSIPDKVGSVPVKMSGWAGGIWQKGKQIASGAGDLAFAGTLLTPAMLTGTAFAGVGGVEKLARKLNEVFDAQWAKLQNLQPVQDFDRLFEVKKKLLRDKLSKIDSSGKETSTILSTIDALGKYGRENPIKSGIIIGLLTFAAAISAGTLGLGVLASSQVFILATAVSFVLRTGLGLLKGESASASVGAGVKTGVATLAGGAPVGATVGAIPSIKNESLMLSNIVQDILSEADPATPAPATAPTTPVTPSAPTLNPNQLKAVENLKFNIGKEISTYLKDVAKTFKVKGASTSELVDNLKKIPQAKTAVDIIESLMAEFPKYKLEFPKDVVVDDKEASTPPTPATPGGGGGGGGTAPGGGGGGGGTTPGGGGGGGGTTPGGGGGGGGTTPGGGGGGGGTTPGGGGGGTTPGGGGGGKTPKPKPGTPDPTTPSTPEPTKPGEPEPAKPGTPEPAKPGTPEPAKPGTPEPAKPGEPEPAKPGTPEPKLAGGTPINLTPVLTKQLTSVKQNPLVAGGLANRIKTMSTLKMSNPTDAKYAKTLLQKIKSVALSNLNKASIQKQLGGNVEQLRKELVKEAMTSADINTFAKELGALIPLLVNITYGLRQVMNPRLPKTPATPVTEDATYAQPGIEGRGEKNVAADPNVNEKDLKLIKAFLTKLNQLSVSLKALNVTSPTKEQVKPVIKDILDIFDIINGKLVSGMKVDAQVEALFKDIDLKPTVNIKDGLMLKVKLGNVPNIYKFEKGAWSHRQKDGTFVTVNPNEKRGKEIFDQLTALAKNGQDNTAQIQKDDEEKAKVDKAKKDSDEEQAKLKKADDDKAAAEKDRKAGIERTKAAAAGTRAKATPKTGPDIVKPGEPLTWRKSKFEENFKSDYKNYF